MSAHTDKRALRDVPAHQRQGHFSQRGLYPLLLDVAARHHVTHYDILGSSRDQSIANARACLCWHLHEDKGLSYPQIGYLLGRDHTTIHTIVARHWRRIQSGEAALPEGVTVERSAAE